MKKKIMKMKIGGKTKIKRCGYTPYGYKAYINNRQIEFATESELNEYIKECNNGFMSTI